MKSTRAAVYHPAIYGAGGDSAVVQFVSVTSDGSVRGAAVQDRDPRVAGDTPPSSGPPQVETSKNLSLEKPPANEPLTIQIGAVEEAQLADASATKILQMEPASAIATIGDRSKTGERAHGSFAGQGNNRSQDGDGSGRSGGGGGGFGGPAYLRNPPPPYPRMAREHGWEGATLLQVEVLDDGSGGKVEVLKSSGYPVLDEAAVDTVRHWRFLPARSGDTPIRSLVEIPIRFRLADN